MKNTEKTSYLQKPNKKAGPEEYDLVILGGGTGATIAAWTFAGKGQRVAIIERKYVAAPARTSHVSPARTSFTARRSLPTCAAAKSSA